MSSETLTDAADLLETAWVVIANASDWGERDDWQEAAERWRDQYHLWLDQYLDSPPSSEVE